MKTVLLILTVIMSLFAEKILPIIELEQRKDQWCWAGSSTAILTYYGEKVSQGQIVQFALSSTQTGPGDSTLNAWNYLWTSGATRSSIVHNGTQFYGFGINHIMTKWNTPHEYGNYNLTETQFKSEINDGHPFIIRWGWTSGGGHFVVGQGYLDNGNYQIMDPWFGNGYTVNSYNWINTAQGGQGNWTHTMTTDRSTTTATYALTITGGTGSGSYEAANTVSITATVPAGKEFLKWSGAGTAITDSLKANATITMPAKALTVTAQFTDLPVVDTSNLSKNFVEIGTWESLTDELGSSVSLDTTRKSEREMSAILVLAKDAAPSYSWGKVTITANGTYDLATAIKLTYSASDSIRIVLDNPALGIDGIDFGVTLAGSSTPQTVIIPFSAFKQPKWIEPTQSATFDPKAIKSVSIEAVRKESATSLTVNELQINKFIENDPVPLKKLGGSNFSTAVVDGNNIQLSGITGPISLTIYALSGRVLYNHSQLVSSNGTGIALPQLGKGVAILRIEGQGMTKTIKLHQN